MPAFREFPKMVNRSALAAGLVLQTRPVLEENEFGLFQSTLQFITANENWPRLRVPRGTVVDLVRAGDDLSARILKAYNFLGVQTARFTRDGHVPGIGLVELMCQGAIFDIFDGVYPLYDPSNIGRSGSDTPTPTDEELAAADISSPVNGTKLTSNSITFTFKTTADRLLSIGTAAQRKDIAFIHLKSGRNSVTINNIPTDGRTIFVRDQWKVYGRVYNDEQYQYPTGEPDDDPSEDNLVGKSFGPITTPYFNPASTQQSVTIPVIRFGTFRCDAIVEYHALDLHYEYVARDFSRRSRFLQSSYEWDKKRDIVSVATGVPGETIELEILIDSVRIEESGGPVVLEHPLPGVADLFLNPENHWRENVLLAGVGARFEQPRAGCYYHVNETAQIQLSPKRAAAD